MIVAVRDGPVDHGGTPLRSAEPLTRIATPGAGEPSGAPDATRGSEVEMPFKSKAQRRKFAQLLVEGKISDQTYEEWNRSTGKKELPERVTPKKTAARAKRTTKRKTASH
jgi:hypothetical protein